MVDQIVERQVTSPPWWHGATPNVQIEVGTAVDVRSRFVGGWSPGFEIAEHVEDGYRIRRSSDGAILPDVFGDDEVKPDLRTRGLGW